MNIINKIVNVSWSFNGNRYTLNWPFIIIVVGGALLISLLSGCDDTERDKRYEEREKYVLTPELKDCTVSVIENGFGNKLYVVRCPEVTITHKGGKFHTTVSTENTRGN